MKTYTGSFGVDTQASNSLVSNLLKHPEIGKTLIKQYPRYALTYLLERTGRFANLNVLGDKSFEWKVLGRSSKACMIEAGSTTEALSASAASVTIGLDNNWLAKFDVVLDSAGNVGQVTSAKPTATSTVNGVSAYEYVIAFANGHAAFAAGDTVGIIGTSFGEGSLGADVSEGTVYPDTYKNYLTLNRKKISITGSALTDVTWIENNGSRLWYFTAEKQFTDEFMYQLELQRWFGRNNVAGTAQTFPGGNNGAIADQNAIMGDGILAQIEGTSTVTYSKATGLKEDDLAKFIAELSRNAQSPEGNEWVVFTGTEGRYQFHKAMKELVVGSIAAGSMIDVKTGSDVALGANFTSYNVLGNKLTVAYCPVFDDAHAHGDAAGTGGAMSGKMVFLDFSSVDGVPNIQMIAKGADGYNRNYVKKYIPGMVNPYDSKSMLAANGDDSFTCQIMSESGIVVRNPLSCGILEMVA